MVGVPGKGWGGIGWPAAGGHPRGWGGIGWPSKSHDRYTSLRAAYSDESIRSPRT